MVKVSLILLFISVLVLAGPSLRYAALTVQKKSSMGFNSGEYGGRNL